MANRLARETSPYLLQHANNPVDWYPWGEDALSRARSEDKPILLSVGYSACHWCHVMEHESFEDAAVAEIMNRDFVNIKVDREERPDLDEIYMHAVQAFTGGHGGWPMTVFLLPDGRPFLGGTYFPPAAGRGMPSFRQIMSRAIELYRKERTMLEGITARVVEAVRGSGILPAPADELAGSWLEPIAEGAEEDFDERWGGFGRAPKFPPHGTLAVLLAHYRRSGQARSLEMVTRTLDAMARGGMYDLLGGGFARYSVDERWCIPHFEKMLYDNAQLVPIYLDAFLLTGRADYETIARETLDWVLREMTHPAGGFYSALDADSEGEEGKYYVFTPAELAKILGEPEGRRAAELFSVTPEGNFEHGTSALRFRTDRSELSAADRELYLSVRPRLLAAREERVRPGLDDKIITAWNGMMISAFARAASVLDDARYLQAASRAAEFMQEKLDAGGRLLRTFKGDRAHILGYLDDHTLLGEALVDLYLATFEEKWLARAVSLADRIVALFWDHAEGGLFFTGHDAEKLVARSKNLIGGATPSGNGTAARLFVRLAELTGRGDLAEKAERILRSYQALLSRAPRALGVEALAGAHLLGPAQELGIAGDPASEDTRAMIREMRRRYLPFAVSALVRPGAETSALLPWLEGKEMIAGKATGYLCEAKACLAPAKSLEAWKADLDRVEKPAAPRPAAALDRTRVRAPELPRDPASWVNLDHPLSLEKLRGNIVVLDFWTYCCINCMHVLPELEAVEQRFASEPVVVLGVHAAKFTAEKERENVATAIARHGIHHPVVLDSEHTLWNEYAVHSWPTLVVVDAAGKIAWRKSGEVDREELARVVQRLLEEARAEHQIGEKAVARIEISEASGALQFPGKIHVYPDAQHQALGEDPFGDKARAYISDTGHHRILEAAIARGPGGWPVLRRLRSFGDGKPGFTDGPAETARFKNPQGVFRHEDTLWIADTENHALRAIDLGSGRARTVAGNGERGRGGRTNPSKPRELSLRSPWDVAALDGGVFIAMAGAHQIWVYLPDRDQIGPMIGTGAESHVDGPAAEAALAQPSGLALYGHLLFFADSETSSIRLADLKAHEIATIVGRGLFDFGDVDGANDIVRLQHPLGVAVTQGLVYVADTFNNKIKRIDLDAHQTQTQTAAVKEPGGLAVLGDYLLIADTSNHRIRAFHRQSKQIQDVPLE